MWRMLRRARKVPAAPCTRATFRTGLIGGQQPRLENPSDFAQSLFTVSLPPFFPHPLKPARILRRDFLLGCGTLIALAAVPGLRTPAHETDSGLDDFMLVSQTVSGAPLNRHAGLSRFSALLQADDRFIEHIQTLAWLVRRHPGLDGAGLVNLLNADPAPELRAALGRLVDAWSGWPDAAPALADARALIDRPPSPDLPSG